MNTIDQARHLHLVNLSELTSKSTLGQIDKIHASQLPIHENINTEYIKAKVKILASMSCGILIISHFTHYIIISIF